MRYLIDGMNVIGTRPDGWWRDRDGAMLRLVKQLEGWAAHEGEDVTVVFERPPSPPIRSTVIEVAHAPRPRADAADDEIVRRLRAEAPRARAGVIPPAAPATLPQAPAWQTSRAAAKRPVRAGAAWERRAATRPDRPAGGSPSRRMRRGGRAGAGAGPACRGATAAGWP